LVTPKFEPLFNRPASTDFFAESERDEEKKVKNLLNDLDEPLLEASGHHAVQRHALKIENKIGHFVDKKKAQSKL
jgi:hypothetical protein